MAVPSNNPIIKLPNINIDFNWKNIVTTQYAPTHTPVIDNGNQNWGTGDDFSYSGGGSDSTVENGRSTANNGDKKEVETAMGAVGTIVSNTDNSTAVAQSKNDTEIANTNVKNAEQNQSGAINKKQQQDGVVAGKEKAANNAQQIKSDAEIAVDAANEGLTKAKKHVTNCETAKTSATNAYNAAKATTKQARQAYNNADPKAKPALLAALNAAEAAEAAAKEQLELAEAELDLAKQKQAVAEKELKIATKKLNNAEADVSKLEADLKIDKDKLSQLEDAVLRAKINLNEANEELKTNLAIYEEHKSTVQKEAKEVYDALEKRLKELEEEESEEKTDSKKSTKETTKKTGWDVASTALSGLGQIGQLGQMFNQANNTNNANSSGKKVQLTAAGSALLDKTIQDTSAFINKFTKVGPDNLLYYDLAMSTNTTANNTNTAQPTTNSSSNATNPFVLTNKKNA